MRERHIQNLKNLSNFSDIKDEELRRRNRGAVLANIFEDYYGDTKTASYSFRDTLIAMEGYLNQFPHSEHKHIKSEMHVHLESRGYRFGS